MFKKSMMCSLKVLLSILFFLFNLNNAFSQTIINTSAKYAILMDSDSGRILLNKNSKVAMAPASMSKLMTIYMVFEAIKLDRISLDTELLVSENAWRKKDKKNDTENSHYNILLKQIHFSKTFFKITICRSISMFNVV